MSCAIQLKAIALEMLKEVITEMHLEITHFPGGNELNWTVMLCGVTALCNHQSDYRQVFNISRTKSQHLKDSRTVLRLSLPNPLKPDVKSRMKM